MYASFFVFAVAVLAVASVFGFVVEYGRDIVRAVKYRKVNKIINNQRINRY